ncbi:MAG: GGDEF domain-containing protein [Treponema sp.]|nr:GGDEF domain-containing protein [Treponema sp.]
MDQKIKLSGRTITAFIISIVLCSIIIIVLIALNPGLQFWYLNAENIALAAAGLLLTVFISIIVQFDVEIKQMKEYFKNIAVKDPLTSVYNRRYIDENIDRLIKSISRANSILSLMMIDLDFFKKYNENYGHEKGDNCLKNIAKVLTLSLKRDNDVIARYGGEEFIVILPYTDEKGANMIAERLLKNIKDFNIPHEKSEVSDRMTISIGIVTGGSNFSLTGDDYINKAGDALLVSKQNGRDRYTLLNI